MLFLRVFLRDPDRIQVKSVIISPGEPDDDLVPSRETARGVQSMPKTPDDPVAHFETIFHKYRVKDYIQRDDSGSFAADAILNKIANLPANVALGVQYSDTLLDNPALLADVVIDREFVFIFLAQVIRWGGDDQLYKPIRQLSEETQAITLVKDEIGSGVKSVSYLYFFSFHLFLRLSRTYYLIIFCIKQPLDGNSSISLSRVKYRK